jgi:undecaprenyl-diphosphatase
LSDWLKVVILGIVEGLTEFLPVSSTGHLIVTSTLLDFREHLRFTFEICIQMGAVVAVLAFYWNDLIWQLRNVRQNPNIQRLWLGVILAFIPFAVIGMLARDWLMATLFSPAIIAVSLILGGCVLLAVEAYYKRRPRPVAPAVDTTERQPTPITLRQAVIVGLSQVVALIPGVSRSAASIVGGMAAGMSRRSATEFSFLLALPTLGGATTYELITSLDDIQPGDIGYLLAGMVVSGLVAWVVIRWLLRYVSRNSFVPLAYYRIAAGIVILLLIAAQILPVTR